jgi:hypothetical protein
MGRNVSRFGEKLLIDAGVLRSDEKPRRRLWLNDGSCIRLRPEHRNHVWSYDFVDARTTTAACGC